MSFRSIFTYVYTADAVQQVRAVSSPLHATINPFPHFPVLNPRKAVRRGLYGRTFLRSEFRLVDKQTPYVHDTVEWSTASGSDCDGSCYGDMDERGILGSQYKSTWLWPFSPLMLIRCRHVDAASHRSDRGPYEQDNITDR